MFILWHCAEFKFSVSESINYRRTTIRLDHVLRTFCAGQKGPAGQDLAGRPLGQETDQGSRFRDEHRKVGRWHPPAESEDGTPNVGSSAVGSCEDLFTQSQVFVGRLQ